MTVIGIIGSGSHGSTVARLALDAGYEVAISNSRGPETLGDVIAELGAGSRAVTAAEAARIGELILVSVPMTAYNRLPLEELRGKVVMDTLNYYPDRDGLIPELAGQEMTTSELVQGHLSSSHVVKVFNNIPMSSLQALPRTRGAADRSTLPIAGDDVTSKKEVVAFLDQIGFDALDTGALRDSWRFERGKPAYVYPYNVERDFDRPQPVDVRTLTERLREAKRG